MKTIVSYVPHGINDSEYFPIPETHVDYTEFSQFKKQFRDDNNVDFIVFWNNRNVRRKNPGDVILSFKAFCDSLSDADASRCALLMHTDLRDQNGTDLLAVKKAICPKYRVIFSDQKVPTKFLNYYYNLSDVTLNIASNEGFGLSSAESIMSGTPVINNVTGGLQDQMRFTDDAGNWITFDSILQSNHIGKYKEHGDWAYPVFPSNRSLQGSFPTPYIFDDRCSYTDVAKGIMWWFLMAPLDRRRLGLQGREWMLSRESGMSAKEMGRRMKESINYTIDNFVKRSRYDVIKVENEKEIDDKSLSLK